MGLTKVHTNALNPFFL